MQPVHVSLCVRKDSEGIFHHCDVPVKLVYACLSIRKYSETIFYHCCGLLKLVMASLHVRKNIESCFLGVVNLVHTSECQKLFRKQFSSLWRSCEALLCSFGSQEGPFIT